MNLFAKSIRSITIRHGTPNNPWICTMSNPIGATVVDNTIIVLQRWYPEVKETEVCRFTDAFVARQAYEVVKTAIEYGWDYVDLIPKDCDKTGGVFFTESAIALPK